jgi:hypothetical protein
MEPFPREYEHFARLIGHCSLERRHGDAFLYNRVSSMTSSRPKERLHVDIDFRRFREKADPHKVKHGNGQNQREHRHANELRVHNILILGIQLAHLISCHITGFNLREIFILVFAEEKGRCRLGSRSRSSSRDGRSRRRALRRKGRRRPQGDSQKEQGTERNHRIRKAWNGK